MQVTVAQLRKLTPKGNAGIIAHLAVALPAFLPAYGITSEASRRFRQFIAQAAHESAGFTTLEEIGGTAYFEKHYGVGTVEGKILGNVHAGDGARYHGRGIFELTGLTNYAIMSSRIGVDLVADPEAAAEPDDSVKIAGEYWKGKGLNALADKNDIDEITVKINGKQKRGLAERKAYLKKAEEIWPDEARPAEPALVWAAAIPAASPPKPLAASPALPAAAPLEPGRPAAAIAPAPAPVALSVAGADAGPVDWQMEAAPPIATDVPPSLATSKTLWSGVGAWIAGNVGGASFGGLLDNPNSTWLILGVLGFTLVGGLGLAVLFRERILKRLELGI